MTPTETHPSALLELEGEQACQNDPHENDDVGAARQVDHDGGHACVHPHVARIGYALQPQQQYACAQKGHGKAGRDIFSRASSARTAWASSPLLATASMLNGNHHIPDWLGCKSDGTPRLLRLARFARALPTGVWRIRIWRGQAIRGGVLVFLQIQWAELGDIFICLEQQAGSVWQTALWAIANAALGRPD